jgi:hypothetical protein
MGSRLGQRFAVPARLRLSACATSGPAHRASSIAVPSVAHVCERLGSMRRVHSLTHQRMITRNFQLIIVQTSKGHPIPNPSRHMRPNLAPCGKLVYLNGDRCRTPTKWPRSGIGRRRTIKEGRHASGHLPFGTSCRNPTIRRHCHHRESAGSSEPCVSTSVGSVAPCEIILLVVGL